MQIKALPYQFYRRLPIDDSTPKEAIQRWEKLRLYDRLRRQGCSQKLALEAIGWSRSTYYRWRKRLDTFGLDGLVARSRCPRRLRSPQWSFQDERLVWQMRRRYPFCGKLRLHLFCSKSMRLPAASPRSVASWPRRCAWAASVLVPSTRDVWAPNGAATSRKATLNAGATA